MATETDHQDESAKYGEETLKEGMSSLDIFDMANTGGLPLELWRIVIAYLPIPDMCCCTWVCKSWRHLVVSLDGTVWRSHFMRSTEWKCPGWPSMEHQDLEKSWMAKYKEHYLRARLWTLGNREEDQTQCLHHFRRKRERKIIRVGPGHEHECLKSALSVASEYDRIILAPGLYDEQFEMSSKIPFEIIGEGSVGSVILLICIEQNAQTGRLCNLVLRAPWFTAHVLKVVSGHLQVDNCVVEDGQVMVSSPGTIHCRYTSFVRTQVTCAHISLSLIENCDFSECETCAIVVEGAPKGEPNWAHKYLLYWADTYGLRQRRLRKTQSCHDECSVGNLDVESEMPVSEVKQTLDPASPRKKSGLSRLATGQTLTVAPVDATSRATSDQSSDCDEWDTDSSDETNPSVAQHYAGGSAPGPSWLQEDKAPPVWDKENKQNLADLLRQDQVLQDQLLRVTGCLVRQCRVSQGQGGVTVASQGALRIEQSELRDLQYGIRCLQNAKVVALENVIHRCTTSGIFMRLGAFGVIAGNDIHTTGEAGIDIRKQADPLIQYNRVHHSKRSGIVVLGSGRGTIKANDIYQNREAGIYILYKGDPYISENRICHGEAAGIAVTESGRGYIGGNLISGNRWGGIDIRRGADPRVTRNLICNGLADGIVVGTKGCGTVDANIVRGNLGCGIWVMSGRPVIQANKVYNNRDSGIVLVHRDPDDLQSADGSDSDSDVGEGLLMPPGAQGGATSDPAPHVSMHHTCLKFNSVYNNSGHGLVANSNELVLVSGNGFHGNRSTGIYIKQAATVTLSNNSVTSNAGTGLQVAAQAKVEVEGNGIYDNIGSGMYVAGEATLTGNDIFYNQMTALSVESGAHVQISKNRIFSAYDPAVAISKEVTGNVEGNIIYEGRSQSPVSHPSNTTCRISDNNVVKTQQGSDLTRRGIDWYLTDPPPRPHIEAPPAISIPSTPARRVMSASRVMAPPGGNCQQGSKMCVIL